MVVTGALWAYAIRHYRSTGSCRDAADQLDDVSRTFTVTIKMLIGILVPTSGRVRVALEEPTIDEIVGCIYRRDVA